MPKTIFLPIKPKYANSIRIGEKKWEFRKKVPKEVVSKIVVYSSSPEKKVLGIAEVVDCIGGSTEEVWKRAGSKRGVTRKEFDDYFSNSEKAYAFKLGRFHSIENIDFSKYIKSVPQSFCYCSYEFEEYIFNCILKSRKRVFITGVHGVGKTTLLKSLKTKVEKYSVSSLMAEYEVLEQEFFERQSGFVNSFVQSKFSTEFIIDGHLMLLEGGDFKQVPYMVLLKLGVTDIVLLIDDPDSIYRRNFKYELSLDEITTMQSMEIDTAKYLCSVYGMNLHIFSSLISARCFLEASLP